MKTCSDTAKKQQQRDSRFWHLCKRRGYKNLTQIYPRSWALIIITSTNKPPVMMMMHAIIWRRRTAFMTRVLGLRQLKKRKHSNIHKSYHHMYSTKSPRYNIV